MIRRILFFLVLVSFTLLHLFPLFRGLDTPQAIYDTPRTRFVAQFIGETNLIEANVIGVDDGKARVALADDVSLLVNAGPGVAPGQKVAISLRPERIHLADEPKSGNALRMVARRARHHATGKHCPVDLRDLVERAPELERTNALQAFRLEEHPPARCPVERGMRDERRR